MAGLVGFMNSLAGRAGRGVLGAGLLCWGFGVLGGTTGAIVGVIGLAPIALGLAGRCLLSPLAPHAKPTNS